MHESTFDLIIKNGFIVDGSGQPGQQADVGISGERIASVGALEHASAKYAIEAHNLVVAPGFIDIHSHSDFTLLANPEADGKVRQGVTTELIGQCGVSGAPMLGEFKDRRKEELVALGLDPTWTTIEEYFALLEEATPIVNVATLVGHGNLRAGVMGYTNRPPSRNEQHHMRSLLEESLQAGALGLSAGLIYPPGVYSSSKELTDLARLVSRSSGVYATHLRSEGDQLEEALTEALTVARETGVSLQIAHLKTYGERNWSKLPAVFDRIEEARKSGLSVHADRYPYTASFTDLDVLLPSWAWEKGAQHELTLLADPKVRKKITDEVLLANPEAEFWKKIVIATVKNDQNRSAEGKSLALLAAERKQDPWEVLYDLLLDEALRVTAIFFAMSDDNLQKILAKDYVMVGTDSAARSIAPKRVEGKPHPRGFGTFPRFLCQWTGPGKPLSLEQAIYKVTGMPAEKLGLRDRGYLQPGFYADIAVFDPAAIRDRADYEKPFQPPEGIEHVLVNGQLVLFDGIMTGKRPGKILQRR